LVHGQLGGPLRLSLQVLAWWQFASHLHLCVLQVVVHKHALVLHVLHLWLLLRLRHQELRLVRLQLSQLLLFESYWV